MNEYSPQSLQDRVRDDVPLLTELLNDYYHSSDEPLIDRGFDQAVDKSFAYVKALNSVFELGDNSESLEAIYRSFHFAVNIAGLAGWNHQEAQAMYSYFLTVVGECGDDTMQIAQHIMEDTNAFMLDNKILGQLVQSYSSELASNEELHPLCRTVAALTLMQIDQDIAYRSDEAEAKRFEQALDAWDGTIEGME